MSLGRADKFVLMQLLVSVSMRETSSVSHVMLLRCVNLALNAHYCVCWRLKIQGRRIGIGTTILVTLRSSQAAHEVVSVARTAVSESVSASSALTCLLLISDREHVWPTPLPSVSVDTCSGQCPHTARAANSATQIDFFLKPATPQLGGKMDRALAFWNVLHEEWADVAVLLIIL